MSWQLRGRRFTPEPVSSEPPQVTGRRRDATLIDRAAAGAAFGLLHDLELVVQRMEEEPHRLLRTGGLGTRELTLVARGLGADPAHTTFLVECASAAGLLAAGPGLALLPTSEYDRWVTLDAPIRWMLATQAWLRTDRLFSRAAERGAHALGPEAELAGIADLRATVLELAAQSGAGTVVDLDQLAAAVAWHRPRLLDGPLDAAALISATWREGAWLGLVALDAVSSFAQLPARPDQAVPAELAALFPAPVEQIIIQNDLTAVAAGPLAYAVAQDLRRLADQESRGAAGVFRFSPTSLRRAYDLGWSSGDVHEWLARHSVTPVPQPLHYLVDDVARRHGGVRIGPALSYVRLEDETQAAALLARPDAAEAGLRAIAPTVLVAAVEEEELLALLREAGHAPVVEDAYGQVRTQPAGPRIARPPMGRRTAPPTAAELAATLLAAERAHPVRRLPEPSPQHRRGGPRPTLSDPGSPPGPGPVRHRGRPADRTRTGSAGPGCRHGPGGRSGHRPGHHNSAGPHFFGLSCHTPRLDWAGAPGDDQTNDRLWRVRTRGRQPVPGAEHGWSTPDLRTSPARRPTRRSDQRPVRRAAPGGRNRRDSHDRPDQPGRPSAADRPGHGDQPPHSARYAETVSRPHAVRRGKQPR